ncbi:hypothetical protein [Thermosipho globiformans]|uniref:hypothetical protein n=1 Tax=Thermosipho globiformans TaxID=380685 RepID=UPI0013E0BA19|nr:hypothetical protein [Thermosipho globiformans]
MIKDFCTRILLLDNGKLKLDIETKHLKNKFGYKNLVIDFEGKPTKTIVENIRLFGYPIEIEKNSIKIKVPYENKEEIEEIKRKILMYSNVVSFRIEEMSYEEIINWLVGEFC